MRVLGCLLMFASVACAAEPSSEEQQAFVARVRAYAQSYGDRLQDFTCNKVVTRSLDTSGTETRWKPLDTQEQGLTYVAHKEIYKLLKVDGDANNAQARVKKGYAVMKGEFDSLPHIFDARARTELAWDHAEGSICVLRYHATLESGAAMHSHRDGKDEAIPHHGLIYAGCDSGVVARFHMETDSVKGKPPSAQADITYGPVNIGGKQFNLPLTADDFSRSGKTITRAEVKFTNYRKYDSESAIHFDGEK